MRNNFIKKTLKNGVKLYLYIDPKMRKMYVDYGVDYGSSGKWFDFYYKDKHYHVLPGCAHFLEHMLGEHSRYGNIYNYFSEKKYMKNATTSGIRTHYYFMGTEDIKDSIKKIIHVLDDPVFTKEDVEETKHAIVEETKRGLNNKGLKSLAACSRNLYKDLNLYHESLNTIGNKETTKKLNYETLKLCYDAFYYDENKTLIIAGNFDEKEMTDYVESIYDEIKPHKKEVREYEYNNLDKIDKKEEINYMATNDDFITIGFKQKLPNFSNIEKYYYSCFMYSLKFSSDTKFIERLKEENIITSMNGINDFILNDKYYNIFIMANVKDYERYKEEVLKEIKINNFLEKDFELLKRDCISSEAFSLDYKYKKLLNFMHKRRISDNFDDIDFLKSMTFNRFIEFYNSLNFDEFSISIVRNIDVK